jgi:hypothetical protein
LTGFAGDAMQAIARGDNGSILGDFWREQDFNRFA